uniref:Transposase n=1 Tax=Steinernema glaseri TaxID=37863 RepID=A0A1I7ZJW7_9BILA
MYGALRASRTTLSLAEDRPVTHFVNVSLVRDENKIIWKTCPYEVLSTTLNESDFPEKERQIPRVAERHWSLGDKRH